MLDNQKPRLFASIKIFLNILYIKNSSRCEISIFISEA